MSTDIEKIVEENWEELKGSLKGQWRKLTHQDIKQIEGSYDILMGKLKKIYGYTKSEIEDEIREFINSQGFDGAKNTITDLVSSAQGNALNLKQFIENNLKKSFTTIKETTIDIEESVMDYVKENPVKTVGIAVVASLVLTKVFASRQ